MYSLISIDPGVSYAAWAVWEHFDGAVWALMDVGLGPHEDLPAASRAVIELPKFRRLGKARIKDIEDLMGAAWRISGRYGEAVMVPPEQWKGQVPKKIHQKKIELALTDSELDLIPGNKAARKQILDAVGIGLWQVGRMR